MLSEDYFNPQSKSFFYSLMLFILAKSEFLLNKQ